MSARFKLPDPDDCGPALLGVAALILLTGVAFVLVWVVEGVVSFPRSVQIPAYRDGRLERDPRMVITSSRRFSPAVRELEIARIAIGYSKPNAPKSVLADFSEGESQLIRPVNWSVAAELVMYRLDRERVALVSSSGLCVFEWDAWKSEAHPGSHVSVLALVVGEGSFVPEDVDAVVQSVRAVRERVEAGTLGPDVFLYQPGATFEGVPTDVDLSACLRTGVPAAVVVVRELAAAGGTVLYPRTSAALGK